MADDTPLPPSKVDPERPRGDNPFDEQQGAMGETYSREREVEEGARHARPHVDMRPDAEGRDIPPADGQRASFSAGTGAVKGSGMGTGGGQGGEDFSDDPETGSGYPLTGGEGRD